MCDSVEYDRCNCVTQEVDKLEYEPVLLHKLCKQLFYYFEISP